MRQRGWVAGAGAGLVLALLVGCGGGSHTATPGAPHGRAETNYPGDPPGDVLWVDPQMNQPVSDPVAPPPLPPTNPDSGSTDPGAPPPPPPDDNTWLVPPPDPYVENPPPMPPDPYVENPPPPMPPDPYVEAPPPLPPDPYVEAPPPPDPLPPDPYVEAPQPPPLPPDPYVEAPPPPVPGDSQYVYDPGPPPPMPPSEPEPGAETPPPPMPPDAMVYQNVMALVAGDEIDSATTPTNHDYRSFGVKPASLRFQYQGAAEPAALHHAGYHAADRALKSWYKASDGKQVNLAYAPAGNRTAARDGVSVVTWRRFTGPGQNCPAVVYVWHNGDRIVEADIVLNLRHRFAVNRAIRQGQRGVHGRRGFYDLQSVLVHEAGHAFGLSDLTDSRDRAGAMFWRISPGTVSRQLLSDGDRSGLRSQIRRWPRRFGHR